MVLHGAAHLFYEDFVTGIRQLFDLHDLLCYFGERDGFWKQLAERAQLHGLQRTHFYLLRYTSRIVGTSIPAEAMTAAQVGAPSGGVLLVMDWLITQALLPESLDEPRRRAKFARWLLYLRSHWLRMPPLLLAYHLSIKALRRVGEWTQVVRAGG